MYFVLRPKLKATKEIDTRTEEQNKVLQHDKECYEQEIKTLRNTSLILQEELSDTRTKIAGLYAKEKYLQDHIEKTRETIDKDNDIIYQKSFDLM
jgi:peptidoglycan hydrolase CwlO-like protein